MSLSKAVLIGNARAGKSALTALLYGAAFPEEYAATLACDAVPISHGGKHFSLWDLGGSPALAGIGAAYCKKASVVAILFSLADAASFAAVSEWYKKVREVESKAQVVLVGTHLDAHQAVSKRDISTLSADIGAPAFLISSRTGEGVKALGDVFARMV